MARRSKLPGGYFWRGGVVWVRTDPITKKQGTTGCRDLESLRAWRRQREHDAGDPRHAAAHQATLGQWIALTLEHKARHRREATVGVYRQKLGHFARLWGVALPLVQITPPLCDTYTETRRAEGAKDLTICKEFSALCQLLKLARRRGCYPHQIEALKPTDLVPNYVPRTRHLDLNEIVALRAACLPRLRAFVSIAVCTGACLSEALKASPDDFTVRPMADDRRLLVVHLRGTKRKDRNRSIPVPAVFEPWLAEAIPQLPISYENNINRDLEIACRRAGIERCTPNDLRRTYASLLKAAGVDKDTLRRLMGHTTSRMVDTVYAVLEPQDLARLAEPHTATLALPAAKPAVVDAAVKVSKLGRSYWSKQNCNSKRNSDPKRTAESAENLGANFEIRTRDLRFTKPFQVIEETPSAAEIAADLAPARPHRTRRKKASSATVSATVLRRRLLLAAALEMGVAA